MEDEEKGEDPRQPTEPAPYVSHPREIRRDAIYQSTASFGRNGASDTAAITDRAKAIVAFIDGTD